MKIRCKVAVAFLCLSAALLAKNVPAPPNPPALVNDYVGILLPHQKNHLEYKLTQFNDSSSTQVAIVIENSLEGDDIFDYSFRLAEAWGIGGKGKNNGVLLYIALKDRNLRIQVGYGLEGVLTDALCKRIIEEIIKPNFREENYFGGLNQATDAIIAITKGEYKADKKEPKSGGVSFIVFFIILIFILWIFSKIGNNGGGKTYHKRGQSSSDILTGMLLGSMLSGSRGGSSWGSFSGGSGSFGGFGGGRFGGGGAGGSW